MTMLRRLDGDQTFVWGKSTEQARSLLAACNDLGIDPAQVQAVGNGFLVPSPVADHITEPPEES